MYGFKYTYIKKYIFSASCRKESVQCYFSEKLFCVLCVYTFIYIYRYTHTYRKPNSPKESLHPFHSQDKHMTVG